MRLREAWVRSRRRLERADIPDADIEAQVLLRNTLGIDRATFHASPDRELSHEDAEAFHGTLERRIEGEPLSYITGHREFYGLDFVVTPDVLVPRQETEFLVEAVLGYARSRGEDERAPTIADIGTGSGAIAVALGCHLPNAVGVCDGREPRGAARRGRERSEARTRGAGPPAARRSVQGAGRTCGRGGVESALFERRRGCRASAGRSARADACPCRRSGWVGRAAQVDSRSV